LHRSIQLLISKISFYLTSVECTSNTVQYVLYKTQYTVFIKVPVGNLFWSIKVLAEMQVPLATQCYSSQRAHCTTSLIQFEADKKWDICHMTGIPQKEENSIHLLQCKLFLCFLQWKHLMMIKELFALPTFFLFFFIWCTYNSCYNQCRLLYFLKFVFLQAHAVFL
jgi:hypothetical protein